MIGNEIVDERKSHDVGANTSLTDWFIGSFDRALDILSTINDNRSITTQFWTARQFNDSETEIAFLQIWPDARWVEDPDGCSVWIVPDIVALQFLQDRGGVTLTECVEIEFSSRLMREMFLAHTDYSAAMEF